MDGPVNAKGQASILRLDPAPLQSESLAGPGGAPTSVYRRLVRSLISVVVPSIVWTQPVMVGFSRTE